ncbi:hypothetical protein [Legionella waltersii]|nr:hypothetical protein [Legionella waltersii]
MKWTDVLWGSYNFVTSTAIDAVATALNVVGSAACIVGGAGVSISNYMQETLSTGYFGGVNILGDVSLNTTVLEMQYSFQETMPFKQNLISTSDGKTFSLQDWADPSKVMWYSYAIVLGGTSLRLMGANLSKWKEGNTDFEHYKNKDGIEIAKPSRTEHLYTTAESLANSIAFASFSSLFSKVTIDTVLWFLEGKLFSYPAQSNETTDSKDYKGPVGEKDFPLDFATSKNITLNLEKFLTLHVNEAINATAMTSVKYGGGAVIKPSNDKRVALGLASGVLAFGAWKAGGFFANKVRLERDKRVPEMEHKEYKSLA